MCCYGNLFEYWFDFDGFGDFGIKIDFVVDDLMGFWVDEVVWFVGVKGVDDDFVFFVDVGQVVGMGSVVDQGEYSCYGCVKQVNFYDGYFVEEWGLMLGVGWVVVY